MLWSYRRVSMMPALRMHRSAVAARSARVGIRPDIDASMVLDVPRDGDLACKNPEPWRLGVFAWANRRGFGAMDERRLAEKELCGSGYLPCQFGVRFSTKAAGPSMPSAVFSRKR